MTQDQAQGKHWIVSISQHLLIRLLKSDNWVHINASIFFFNGYLNILVPGLDFRGPTSEILTT